MTANFSLDDQEKNVFMWSEVYYNLILYEFFERSTFQYSFHIFKIAKLEPGVKNYVFEF